MAFKYIYEIYNKKIYYVVSRYIDNDWDAEEILSSTFVKAFQKLDQLDQLDRFYPWLKKIAINLSLDHLRKNSPLHSSWDQSLENNYYELPKTLETLEEEDLLTLIRDMPEGYRTVFNLYTLEGYSHQEIASMLNFSVGNSKTQLMKSRAWLKQKLTKIYEP
jgi:RNA polymerase sigma factor (sigma-70 family)